jgi:hypothetical protein
MCQKYLSIAVKPKRLNMIHPVHSFRHYAEFRIMPSDFPKALVFGLFAKYYSA